MCDCDGRVDHFHDELRVIFIFRKYYILFLGIPSVLNVEVIAYLDTAGPDKVTLLIISPIYISNNLSHSRSASRNGCLRITVRQIDENIVQNVVGLDDQIRFQLSYFILADHVQNIPVVSNCLDGLPEDSVNIQKDIFCWKILGLIILKIAFAEIPKAYWDYVANWLSKERLDVFLDAPIKLAAHEIFALHEELGLPEIEIKSKAMLENLISGVKKTLELFSVLEFEDGVFVRDDKLG